MGIIMLKKTHTDQRIIAFVVFSLTLIWVPNLFAQPDTLWSREYGEAGVCLYHDGLVLTSDRGYLIHCDQVATGLTPDFRLIKTDSLGNVEWDRVYGGMYMEQNSTVKQTSDGGYILVGMTTSYGAWIGVGWSTLIMKLDSQGDSVWSHVYTYVNNAFPDVPYDLIPKDVVEAPDGGYTFIADMGGSARTLEQWMVKTSVDGDSLWTYRYVNVFYPEPDDRRGFNVIRVTNDGNYIVGGYRYYWGFQSCEQPWLGSPWLMKFTSTGDSIWSYMYDGDNLTELVEGANSELNLCSEDCEIPNQGRGIIVSRTDQFGIELWQRHFRMQPHVQYLPILSLSSTQDDGMLLCLVINGAWGWIMKLSSSGDSLWSIVYDNDNYWPHPYDMQQTQDGGYVALAQRDTGNNVLHLVLFRYGREPQSIGNPPNVSLPADLKLAAYPNPFNASTTISFSLSHSQHATISVYDLTGRRVSTLADEVMNAGEHAVTFDASGLPSGIYFARLTAGSQMQTQKMVLIK
jgi:hypothetical protein